jgi:hypothetical protein
MLPEVSAHYEAWDGTHQIVLRRDPAGRWQVLDAIGAHVRLVETLTGYDDRIEQARALARDYADQQRAHRAGLRELDPFPMRLSADDAPEVA